MMQKIPEEKIPKKKSRKQFAMHCRKIERSKVIKLFKAPHKFKFKFIRTSDMILFFFPSPKIKKIKKICVKKNLH